MESINKEPSMPEPEPSHRLDFTNTENAFSVKSDKELKNMLRVFSLMGNNTLVNIGSKLGLIAIKMNFPFAQKIVKQTIFPIFCGGDSLLDCQETIDKLYKYDTLTVLDYGAEGKNSEEELNEVMEEILRSVDLAASNNSVPVVVAKLSGLANNKLFEEMGEGRELSEANRHLYDQLYERIDNICSRAAERGVGVFIDAEESWVQEGIDKVTMEMMAKYNKEKATIYNTYQLYRHDKLEQLKSDHREAQKGGYILGAKLVRGAYMDKENERAKEEGYPTPIHATKEDTDRDYNEALDYCVRNYTSIASCCASHNQESNKKQALLIEELDLPKDHPHLNFSQLLGMSDYITFNLANAGYNVAKYVPYGPVNEVVPYLIRRAQENTSITGETTRELKMIKEEIARRGV